MKPIVTYSRVSSRAQGRSGLGIEAQEAHMRAFVESNGFVVVGSFVEIQSGAGTDALATRPKLKEALSVARLHDCPVLCAKLDRLSRSVSFISTLIASQTKFIISELGPSVDSFVLHIWASLAQKERELISERTRAALQAAKARGVRLGGNRGNKIVPQATINSVASRQAVSKGKKSNVLPVLKILQMDGVTTLQAMADALNARGIPTPKGKTWTRTQVSRVLNTPID